MSVPAHVAIETAFRGATVQACLSFDTKMYKVKAKLLVVGPCESGKSVISNFLADAAETSGGDYHPTKGARILEFEAPNLKIGNRMSIAEVELWDCSGDRKFESCWPAIARDTNGILFVYNPDQPNHDKELEVWYDYFVQQHSVKESSCVVLAHHRSRHYDSTERPSLPPSFSKISCIHTSVDEDADSIKREFNNFLSTLVSALSDKRDQEELSIMNQR